MIPSSERLSDVLKPCVRHIPAQVHDDLSRIYDLLISSLRGDIKRGKVVMIRHHLDDKFRSDLLGVIGGDDIF